MMRCMITLNDELHDARDHYLSAALVKVIHVERSLEMHHSRT